MQQLSECLHQTVKKKQTPNSKKGNKHQTATSKQKKIKRAWPGGITSAAAALHRVKGGWTQGRLRSIRDAGPNGTQDLSQGGPPPPKAQDKKVRRAVAPPAPSTCLPDEVRF